MLIIESTKYKKALRIAFEIDKRP